MKRTGSLLGHRRSFLYAMLGAAGGFMDAVGGGGWGPIVTTGLLGAGAAPRYVIGTVNASEFLITLAVSLTFLITLLTGHWAEAGDLISNLAAVAGLVVGGLFAAPLGEHLALAERFDDRGHDGDGDLAGCRRADIGTDRSVDPPDDRFGDARLAQPFDAPLMGFSASERAAVFLGDFTDGAMICFVTWAPAHSGQVTRRFFACASKAADEANHASNSCSQSPQMSA